MLQYGRVFDAVIMRSPFLNVRAVMQDPDLPLTMHEYDEWGIGIDSRGKEVTQVFDYIRSYSPIDLMNKQIETLGKVEPNNKDSWLLSQYYDFCRTKRHQGEP